MLKRVVAHLDMDAFYASVELLRYPQLKGLPVVIGGGRRGVGTDPVELQQFALLKNYVGRGVITTATYEARALGVHSGMGLMKAAALAPQAIILPLDFDQYRFYSRAFKAAVLELAPHLEDRGIDEIYLELTDLPGVQADFGRQLAQAIQNRVFEKTGLTCSIGLSSNKLLSKICSDLKKPRGISVLEPHELSLKIWPLSVSKINGVGPKATEKLNELGVFTIGDLAKQNPVELVERFGRSYGQWLHQSAYGQDDRPVITHSEPKSLSRETTFERNLHPRSDKAMLTPLFTALCEKVAADLQRKGYVAKTIGIKLRYEDFSTATRDVSLLVYTDDSGKIREAAGSCLKRIPLNQRLRLLGVRASGLLRKQDVSAAQTGFTASLFDE